MKAYQIYTRAPTAKLGTDVYTNNRSYSNMRRTGIGGYKDDLKERVISRMAMDASGYDFKHAILTSDGKQSDHRETGLIRALTLEANIDQSGKAFVYDAIWSMLEEGTIAIVPEYQFGANLPSTQNNIRTFRVGKITNWMTDKVEVEVYNPLVGYPESFIKNKMEVAIIESPYYSVFQSYSQNLKLLQQKLKVLEKQDSDYLAGRFNGFIQFPYSTKSTELAKRAKSRIGSIESELRTSDVGIAGLDSNEKYVPVNAQLQSNVLEEIRLLKQDYMSDIGITPKIINGEATQQELTIYYSRCIEPLLEAFTTALMRRFIARDDYIKGERILYFRDPFKTIPVEQIASVSDLFTRNAILTPNEVRALVGKPPLDDKSADEAYNRNTPVGTQSDNLGYSEETGENTGLNEMG